VIVLSWLLAVVFAALVGLHVFMLGGIARRALWRAALALVIPPLTPYWGWQLGMRRRVVASCILVVLYAIGVALLAR
jgi:hypothetical protein